MTDSSTCRCPLLQIGHYPVNPNGPRSLREDCPVHGIGTEAYREAVARVEAMRAQRRRAPG